MTLAALVLGGCLLGLGLAIDERRRQAPRLAPAGAAGTDAAPAEPAPPTAGHHPAGTMVLLPVRDEAANLEDCVAALLDLDGAPAVRVIDDGSTDGTDRLAATLAAREARLTVVSAGALPAGWRGKVHAMWVGSQGAGAEWLLLTDADVRMRPAALARALAVAETGRLDAVSLAGFQEAHGIAENLLVPGVFALLDALLGDWQAAAGGAGPAVANGQFLLVRRRAWEDSGGFPAIRHEAIDDMAVVATLRRHGHRTAFLRAPELLSVHMYSGFRAATRGWRRNLGGLLGERRAVVAAAFAALVAPAAALVAAAAAGRLPAAAILWTSGAAASALLRAGSGHSPAWALLYPLDALLVAAVTAAGVRDRRRGRLVSWKGREMRM